MTLAELVRRSNAVAATRARNQKIALLAETLSALAPEEVTLGVAMLSLALRWRTKLARVLAIATSIDAILTVVEVLLDGVTRVQGPMGVMVVVVACLGPTLATSQLWGALLWRSRRAS